MQVNVEVCITSVEEAITAEECGATSVEVCTWLDCGGVTPSSGLVDTVRGAVRIPVRVLVRPGPGSFTYSPAETNALLTDAEIFGGGALGLVTGAIDGQGEVEQRILEAVKRLAPESEITFHRAIDHLADPLRVVESCVELGIDRILTSGGAGLAVDGIPTLIRIIERAGDRIEIAVAGGIDPENVLRIVEQTGAREVHFAAQRRVPGQMKGPALSSAGGNVQFDVIPDRAKIEGVMNALVKAGLR